MGLSMNCVLVWRHELLIQTVVDAPGFLAWETDLSGTSFFPVAFWLPINFGQWWDQRGGGGWEKSELPAHASLRTDCFYWHKVTEPFATQPFLSSPSSEFWVHPFPPLFRPVLLVGDSPWSQALGSCPEHLWCLSLPLREQVLYQSLPHNLLECVTIFYPQ